MKKTELAQFKEEYESAVRNVDEIINNPYTAILLKYKKGHCHQCWSRKMMQQMISLKSN